MLFDTKKYKQSSGCYNDMAPYALAFHNALRRSIVTNGETIEYFLPVAPRKSYAHVCINDNGEIKTKVVTRNKSGKILFDVDGIEEMLNCLLTFICVCCDYGYLIREIPEVPNEADA